MTKSEPDPYIDHIEEAPRSNMVSGAELRSFVERLERLRGEKKEISEQEKLVIAEAKSRGYATKYIKAICKLREKPPSERAEDEAMMELYLAALGMAHDVPLFRHVQGMGVDVTARESVVEALKLIAPEDGEITIRVGSGPRMRIWRSKDGVHVEEVAPDKPSPLHGADNGGRGPVSSRTKTDFPDVSLDEAFMLGQQARQDDQPVIANPFPWDDKRRRRWDEGWRDEDGGDGMGPT